MGVVSIKDFDLPSCCFYCQFLTDHVGYRPKSYCFLSDKKVFDSSVRQSFCRLYVFTDDKEHRL